MSDQPAHRLCVAPMMRRTDRHFRFLVRLITRRTWLYTEMLVAGALVRGDPQRLLVHSAEETPLGLQLAGGDPETLGRAAGIASSWGFDEVNLNVGCPSPRASGARMGVCLMTDPNLVADCVRSMREASGLAVTVKTRIGVDADDDLEFLSRFVTAVAQAGCTTVMVHARKAWLSGLDPKANRSVPPLDYRRVYALKARHPSLEIVVNGGIRTLDDAAAALASADGAMIGRAAYACPWILSDADRRFYKSGDAIDVAIVVHGYLNYLRSLAGDRVAQTAAWRHLGTLLRDGRGARMLRRRLADMGRGRDPAVAERLIEPYLKTCVA